MPHSRIHPAQFATHRGLNRLQTVLLLGFMGGYAGLIGWLLWGSDGLWFVLFWATALLVFSPRFSARWVLRMYGARPIPLEQGFPYLRIVETLAQRAGLPRPPSLWWIPSRMVNAFAVGRRHDAAIAVTQGLLNTLNHRELVGVLAHETAHIAHDDVRVMGLADTISRITSAMSFAGMVMLILTLPQILVGGEVNWWPLLLLSIAPQVSLLAQLGLSRTREFDADLAAARLTDDPQGLAAALIKLERIQHGFMQRILFPGKGLPEPSWLRTHPTTKERVARLQDLKRPEPSAWPWHDELAPPEFPSVRLRTRPRGGIWGYWY